MFSFLTTTQISVFCEGQKVNYRLNRLSLKTSISMSQVTARILGFILLVSLVAEPSSFIDHLVNLTIIQPVWYDRAFTNLQNV